ncbi:glycoside hydrolase family 3 N-terminal domain-containing protein [soil metagenome]
MSLVAARFVWLAAAGVLASCSGAGADGDASSSNAASPATVTGSSEQPAVTTASAPAPTAPQPAKPRPHSTERTERTTPRSPRPPATATTMLAPNVDPFVCLQALPTAVVAGQLVWPAVYGDQLDAQASTFAQWQVGGALLMTWPAGATPEQLAELKTAGEIPLLVATDEEGGDVQRFRRLGVIPSQRQVAASMSVEDAEQMIAEQGLALEAAGVDIVFGPVADVGPADGSDGPMADRVFSADPTIVADYAAAYVRGWNRAGILPVLKHFPGHGSASADSHDDTARTPALDELLRRDLVPYQRLAGEQVGVMIGHLDVPDLTEDVGVPASLSPAAISNLLLNQLGFAGHLVVTDALDMEAVASRVDLPEAAERAVGAGADVVIYADTSATPSVIARLVDAVETGRLAPSRLYGAAQRVLATKGVDPCALGST